MNGEQAAFAPYIPATEMIALCAFTGWRGSARDHGRRMSGILTRMLLFALTP